MTSLETLRRYLRLEAVATKRRANHMRNKAPTYQSRAIEVRRGVSVYC